MTFYQIGVIVVYKQYNHYWSLQRIYGHFVFKSHIFKSRYSKIS